MEGEGSLGGHWGGSIRKEGILTFEVGGWSFAFALETAKGGKGGAGAGGGEGEREGKREEAEDPAGSEKGSSGRLVTKGAW